MAGLSSFRTLPSEFRAALHAFAQSSSSFRILRTVRSEATSSVLPSTSPPEKLYVLDSSFNPPTLGHLSIALSAIRDDVSTEAKHLLLLLATQNADKAPKPALFEQRLAMMSMMAERLVSDVKLGASKDTSAKKGLTVYVGVTKYPYFVDKSNTIADKASDSPLPFPPTRQVHLIGFDTFTRLLDTQYYPPEHTLAAVRPLFDNHSVRVTFRTGDKYGSKETQQQYVKDIAAGKRSSEGAHAAWADRITMVEGRNDEMVTSSTKAREHAVSGDFAGIQEMCGETMAEWIMSEGLYKDDLDKA